MTIDTRPNTRWLLLVVAAAAFVALGASATYLYMRRSMASMENMAGQSAAPAATRIAPATAARRVEGPLADVTITLTPEAVKRAGIIVAPVRRGTDPGTLRLPGVVEPNAYRQVVVTSLVAGRVASVPVSLGDRVRRGQTLVQIYSPELAEAQTRYLSLSAEFEAAHLKLLRTERLVAIGSASTQELEAIRAEHTSHSTELEAARAKLTLLGLAADRIARLRTAADVTATVAVPAPLGGTITERSVNVGANVDPSTALLTVVDLSTVWIIADLYERDFGSLKAGSPVTVTAAAYPGLALQGKVSYLDPQLDVASRTAHLRIEVVNRDQQLRLGMYVDVSASGVPASGGLMVPRSAVQTVGDRQVVYLADPKQPGRFVEREVRLGEAAGKDVRVASGVAAGDVVAVEGSFSLRAELERLGLRSNDAVPSSAPPPPSTATSDGNSQPTKILVGDSAFDPATVTVRAGLLARLTFVRTSEKTCATEVVFPGLNIRKTLPLNEPVVVEFTPQKTGEVAFACGINMLKGLAVVAAH